MTAIVWIPRAPGGEFLPALRRLVEGEVSVHTEDEPPAGVRVLVGGTPTDDQLDACPELERVIVPWAGVTHAVKERLRARPALALHNLHHNAAPTAELAIGLLLAAARRIAPLDRALRKGDWRPRYVEPKPYVTLEGRRALILGFGAIGRRVARALLALGLDVTALSRSGRADPTLPDVPVHEASALDTLLGSADVLMVCLPATKATDGLLDAARLRRLPEGALLVNVGRARIIDQDALFEALESGQLRGAGLDVWYRYPKGPKNRRKTRPSRLRFDRLDHVVLSPHRGGLTQENEAQRAQAVATLLLQIARGEPVDNRVDLDAGY